jgi:hypothetical protein
VTVVEQALSYSTMEGLNMKALAGSLRLHNHPLQATAVLVIAFGLAGCGANSTNSPIAAGAPATSTSTSATPPTAAPAAATTETTTIAAQTPCDAQVFLPVLKEEFDNEAGKLRIVGADVNRCRNGYAKVFAVPDESVCQPGVGYCFEHEQVLLGWTGGRWRILTYGTGITCEAPGFETDAQIRRVCRALGYPGY